MTTSEADDYVAISALRHVTVCERQAALVHVERVWEDNALTAHGQVIHQRTNEPGHDIRGGLRVDRAVLLRSERLRIQGIADCVEWEACTAGPVPRPVETKRGRKTSRLADEVQVCAQAICLEERHGGRISTGVLFYAASRRRVEVPLTEVLRHATEEAAARVHQLIREGRLPPPVFGRKCRVCSLVELCLPASLGVDHSKAYLEECFGGR
jgi:CRISPR-associated exonuclease Cas4